MKLGAPRFIFLCYRYCFAFPIWYTKTCYRAKRGPRLLPSSIWRVGGLMSECSTHSSFAALRPRHPPRCSSLLEAARLARYKPSWNCEVNAKWCIRVFLSTAVSYRRKSTQWDASGKEDGSELVPRSVATKKHSEGGKKCARCVVGGLPWTDVFARCPSPSQVAFKKRGWARKGKMRKTNCELLST